LICLFNQKNNNFFKLILYDCLYDRRAVFTGGIVAHVSMADPVSSELSNVLVESAKEAGATVN